MYKKKHSVKDIIDTANNRWGITKKELLGSKRIDIFVKARIEVAERLRHEIKLSLESIGKILNKHHTTIISYLKKNS